MIDQMIDLAMTAVVGGVVIGMAIALVGSWLLS